MRRLTAVILFSIFLLAACQESAPPPTIELTPAPKILRIGLASSAAPLADLVQDAYQTDTAVLQFITGSTETLWGDLANGRLDALLVHYIPPRNDNWFNPVALDGLTIIVHPENSVENLTLAQVQGLFNGRIQNWQEVGGTDQSITLVSREAGSGALALLNQKVMAEQRLNINAQIAPSQEAMLTTVADNPQAIGFTMMSSTNGLKPVMIEGTIASPENTAVQSYPLTTPLYFVHQDPTEPEGELRAFLAWLQSETGQEIIGERYGRVR